MSVGPRRSSWVEQKAEWAQWAKPWDGKLPPLDPKFSYLIGKQEALDSSADRLQVGFSTNFKGVFGGREELGVHLLQ